jgi:hypothetical protein
MKSKEEIERQIDYAFQELNRITRTYDPGTHKWREQRRYIDALEWVLEGEKQP